MKQVQYFWDPQILGNTVENNVAWAPGHPGFVHPWLFVFIIYLFIYLFIFAVALRPNVGHGVLILEVSRSHTTTQDSR